MLRTQGEEAEMRSAGFPCRWSGCDLAFQVTDQSSMESLRHASDERTSHEVSVHGYHHVALAEERPYSPAARIKVPRST